MSHIPAPRVLPLTIFALSVLLGVKSVTLVRAALADPTQSAQADPTSAQADPTSALANPTQSALANPTQSARANPMQIAQANPTQSAPAAASGSPQATTQQAAAARAAQSAAAAAAGAPVASAPPPLAQPMPQPTAQSTAQSMPQAAAPPVGLATPEAAGPAPTMPSGAPTTTAVGDGERALLGELRRRREDLDAREAALATREATQMAAELRITARVAELQSLQHKLEALEQGRQQREDASWQGLVKLYEAMRPRDAAAIFNDLDMPVLLGVVDRMKDAKAAPVLAAMQPDKARELTTKLAAARMKRAAVAQKN